MPRPVFISYSHADRDWLDRLRTALVPFEDAADVVVLDDTGIAPGEDWAEAIEGYLAAADVAVLLVSARFLASRFVMDVELPALVAAARAGRLTLVWAAVSAAAWEVTPLAGFQAALDPRRPLDLMSPGEANAALVDLAQAVASARTLTGIGRSLRVVDRVAVAVADEGAPPPGVLARNTGEELVFDSRHQEAPVEVITAADLNALPKAEHRLIRSLEESMENSFERWTALRARCDRLTDRERAEYESAGRQMCGELRHILDFVERGLGKYLDDHYRAMRYACDSLVSLPA